MIEIICKSICDRCGEVSERRNAVLTLPPMWSRLKVATKWADNMEYETQEKIEILCKACSAKFRDWFNKP